MAVAQISEVLGVVVQVPGGAGENAAMGISSRTASTMRS